MKDTDHLKEALKFQYSISWQMLEYHLGNLEDEEALWQSSKNSLNVHNIGGEWVADWPETEDYEMGPATIAWTTWHILFWWSMVFDHSFGGGRLTKDAVKWPGTMKEAKKELDQLHEKWTALLDTISKEELLSTDKTKWPFQDVPFYQLAGWLNVELMKNASEIGSVRFMYASRENEESGG